eukprot:632981-Rhodomonas_salina.2
MRTVSRRIGSHVTCAAATQRAGSSLHAARGNWSRSILSGTVPVVGSVVHSSLSQWLRLAAADHETNT